MQKEMSVEEAKEILNEENIHDTILVKRNNKTDIVIMNLEEYKKIFEMNFVEKLKNAEKQIKNGEVTEADIVFKEMRSKYGY